MSRQNMTHQQTRSNSRMSRSPSKSRSRSSEKVLESNSGSSRDKHTQSQEKLLSPKFQMVTKSPSPSRRRASAVHFPSSPSTRVHNRSRSLRNKRYSSNMPHSLSGSHLDSNTNQGRSSISHSLSVPSGDEAMLQDFHLVRNFSVTSKGIINRGDSFRSKSRSTSLCSTPTSPTGGSDDGAFPAFSSGPPSASASPSPPEACASADVPKYVVWLIGCNGVGKSSIRKQFATSEYICQYDNWQDENLNINVTVSLDGVETELEIVESTNIDEKVKLKESAPDAYIIVYSVTNRRSYIQARQILSKIETTFNSKAAILVGNKTDLARLRTVTTVEGRSLAKERGVKFIETSVAINHQLDELLVGIISQIRIKAKIAEKQRKRSGRSEQTSRNKATCIIKRLWRRTCMTSKSCDNLHAL